MRSGRKPGVATNTISRGEPQAGVVRIARFLILERAQEINNCLLIRTL